MKNERTNGKVVDEFSRLFDRLIVSTNSGDFEPRPLVAAESKAAYQALSDRYEDDDHVILVGCALSAFFDPNLHSVNPLYNLKRMSVLFALVRLPETENASPMIFVTDEESNSSGATAFLDGIGAPAIGFDYSLPANIFAERVLSKINPGRKHFADRKPINPIERSVARELNPSSRMEVIAGYKSFFEVMPSRIVPKAILEHNQTLTKAIRGLGPIDVVYCDRETTHPLLCVEVDGLSHERQEARLKDKHKTKTLRAMGLPLLRVLPVDMPLWKKQWLHKSQTYRMLLSSWVRRVLQEVQRDKSNALEEHEFMRRIISLKESLAMATYESNYHSLDERRREIIDSSDLVASLYEEKYLAELARGDLPYSDTVPFDDSFCDPPKALKGYLGRLRLYGDNEAGIHAEGSLKIRGEQSVLTSARFFFSHPYMEGNEIVAVLRSLAAQDVFWQAHRLVRDSLDPK